MSRRPQPPKPEELIAKLDEKFEATKLEVKVKRVKYLSWGNGYSIITIQKGKNSS